MPASRGNPPPLGSRPSSPVRPDDIAAWETRTYPRLGRYAPPPPAEVVLDDVIDDGDDMLAAPDIARLAIVDELGL